MLSFLRSFLAGTESDKVVKRFYSDLTPVSDSVFDRRLFKDHESVSHRWEIRKCVKEALAKLDSAQVFTCGPDRITLTPTSHVGHYRFVVDIKYGFGLRLPLLFTEAEAYDTLSVAKLIPKEVCNTAPMFFDLPRELRERVYFFAVTEGEWRMDDAENSAFNRYKFARCIGDLSGFYFPLNNELAILRVNRQIRQEALPLAYRRTTFHLWDWDELTMFLVSVGQVGRDNIEALEFPVGSPMMNGGNWWVRVAEEDELTNVSSLHVMKCVRLLKRCKRLGTLHFYEIEVLRGYMTFKKYWRNPLMLGIYSFRVMEGRESRENYANGLPTRYDLADWLKSVAKNSRRVKREGEEGVWRTWTVRMGMENGENG